MPLDFDPFRELDRVASSLFERRGPRVMPMDLYRDGDHYVLSADLPGIDPGSVDIDVDGQLLTIRAERTLGASEGVQWITRERQSGSFLRQLTLGQGLDTSRIAASYDNGVLSVTIPVSEAAKPRKIAVTSGAAQAQQLDVDQVAQLRADQVAQHEGAEQHGPGQQGASQQRAGQQAQLRA